MNKRKERREKEIHEDLINLTNQELRSHIDSSHKLVDNQKCPKKYSEVFHIYMKEKFGGEHFIIVEQTALLDTSGRLCISVAALPLEDSL